MTDPPVAGATKRRALFWVSFVAGAPGVLVLLLGAVVKATRAAVVDCSACPEHAIRNELLRASVGLSICVAWAILLVLQMVAARKHAAAAATGLAVSALAWILSGLWFWHL